MPSVLGAFRYLLRSVPALNELMAGATRVGEIEMDRHGRDHIKAYHHFVNTISINGDAKEVHFVLREMDDGRIFYDLNLGGDVGVRALEGPMDARESRVEPELQLNADTLNLILDGGKINENPRMSPAQARAVNAAAKVELEKVGISSRVSAETGEARPGVWRPIGAA